MGCACLFALGASFFPRIALLFLWLFTDLVTRAFSSWIWPLLGLIFFPFTTIMYVLVYTPGVGVHGAEWVWVGLGFLLDLISYGSGAREGRSRYA
jgi:hypothetical protein